MTPQFLPISDASNAQLVACGKSACDCKKESEELMKDAFAAAMSGDESAAKDMEAKVKALEEDCKDYKDTYNIQFR